MITKALGRNGFRFARMSRHRLRVLESGVVIASLLLAALIVGGSGEETLNAVVVGLASAGLVLWIAVQDLKTFTIADSAVFSFACLAFAARYSVGCAVGVIGLDGILIGGVLLAFREGYYRCKGYDGLGLGDVKLAACGGLLVGANAFVLALVAASLLTIGFVGARWIALRLGFGSGRIVRSDRLAFGAVLAPAIWAMWVAEQAHLLTPSAGQ